MDPNTKSMYDILNKLGSVDNTSRIVAERADKDIDLKVAINSKVTENSVSVQNYRIDIVLQEFAGKQKKFYNIVEGNKIIHQELALFETAMGVVKNLMGNKSSKVNELVRYDYDYANSLYEVYTHNSRIKSGKINEDIAVAKLSNSKEKMQQAKNKILQKL